MPKSNIDYSNTVIYKIFCKDKDVTDIYVGHTTNFTKRKYQHKILSADHSQKQLKIYNNIRQHGGWDNWNMVELAVYNCKDSTEARIREQEHYDLLNPTLNVINPISKNTSVVKNICPFEEIEKPKPLVENSCLIENPKIYYCKYCNYYSNKKSNLDRHLLTPKHAKGILSDAKVAESSKNEDVDEITPKYKCEHCDKTYASRNGIWKHKKICSKKPVPKEEHNEISDKDLIMMLIKENAEFKNIMMTLVTNGTNKTTNNTTNINSNNKAFNLNFFLNETCKDAMNIGDFISSIKLNLDDLEHTGRKGYIEGVSNIIVKNLNSIEQHMRPLHCSDTKREILYIKDNNEWTKETDDKPILTKAIKVIANENIKQIKNWRELNPDCTNSSSRKNDLYLKIVSNSMNGLTEEEGKKNINKIISNVAKEVTINKN